MFNNLLSLEISSFTAISIFMNLKQQKIENYRIWYAFMDLEPLLWPICTCFSILKIILMFMRSTSTEWVSLQGAIGMMTKVLKKLSHILSKLSSSGAKK